MRPGETLTQPCRSTSHGRTHTCVLPPSPSLHSIERRRRRLLSFFRCRALLRLAYNAAAQSSFFIRIIYIYIYIDARRVPAVLPPSLLFSPVSLALLGQSRAEPPPPSFFAPPTERAPARDTREWERDRYISI